MNIDKMTQKLQAAINDAQNTAILNNQPEVDSLHLLSALLNQKDTKFTELLKQSGISDLDLLQEKIREGINSLPTVDKVNQLRFDPELYKMILQMQELSQARGDNFTRGELFLPIVINGNSKAKQALVGSGLKIHKVESSLEAILKEKTSSANQEDSEEALTKYTLDFTAKARENKLDPVIGRDEEIRRTIQILGRRTKNNPVLIGKPGVGKTAIAEGLALRIVAGEVPEGLKNKRVLALDLSGMIAGAKFRGEFEERLKSVIKEVEKKSSEIVLFIDEVHTLVGAGKGEGAMDAGNILKPALARGELHCIGATTIDEYRKYIEKDPALERRFQKVMVSEPSVTDTVAILRGLKERYEIHHGVTITDAALVAAAKLSSRYITDRFLPDKAIDLIDEAASLIKMEMESKPESIDKIERKIIQLNVELTVLEKDDLAKEQRRAIALELDQLIQQKNKLVEIWEQQKSESFSVQELKNSIEKTKEQIKTLTKDAQYEEVGRLEYEVLPKLERMLEGRVNLDKNPRQYEEKLFRKTVTAEEIAEVVSKSTGIEVSKMIQTQKDRLLKMESYLSQHIIGQKEAVISVSKAIRRARAGLSDENRPYGSFLFLGPTGVGKTQLVKELAKFLFDSEKNITRIDMSELMEKHAVSRLIGSPPGYVGYEEGGTLTEAVRRKPYSILLLDEIEKAHPDVFNVLLQVLDDGRLTDGQGNIVDFKNTVIVMTSNIGANEIQEEISENKSMGFFTKSNEDLSLDEKYSKIKKAVNSELKKYFRPEFINRIDETVIFQPLDNVSIGEIVKLQLEQVAQKLTSKNYRIKFDQSVINYLVEVGFDPLYGARPIKRAIQSEVESFLSDKILGDEIIEDKKYTLIKKEGFQLLEY